MSKAVLYIVGFAFLGALLLWLLYHVLSALYWVGWMLLWLALLGILGFIAFSVFKPKLPKFVIKKPIQFKLSDPKNAHVYAFHAEPALKDLAMLHDELHIAKLELQGDVVPIESNTIISIVEDTGQDAVKVKIRATRPKDKDRILWVARSSIVKSEQPKLLG